MDFRRFLAVWEAEIAIRVHFGSFLIHFRERLRISFTNPWLSMMKFGAKPVLFGSPQISFIWTLLGHISHKISIRNYLDFLVQVKLFFEWIGAVVTLRDFA